MCYLSVFSRTFEIKRSPLLNSVNFHVSYKKEKTEFEVIKQFKRKKNWIAFPLPQTLGKGWNSWLCSNERCHWPTRTSLAASIRSNFRRILLSVTFRMTIAENVAPVDATLFVHRTGNRDIRNGIIYFEQLSSQDAVVAENARAAASDFSTAFQRNFPTSCWFGGYPVISKGRDRKLTKSNIDESVIRSYKLAGLLFF